MRSGEGVKQNGSDSQAAYFQKSPTDQELFEEALSSLSNEDNEPNYNEAKSRLENLLQQYPESRYKTSAAALVATLSKIGALEAKLRQEKQKAHADHAKLSREIEGLKDNCKQGEEKYTAEVTRLQQENDQLKNDIQQLKRLEVQLEKREKSLR